MSALSMHVRVLLAAFAVLSLSACALSHGRPGDDAVGLPSALVGDWTFESPVCDSINRLAWVTLCSDGTGWLSDHVDYPYSWETFVREASAIDERSIRFDPTEVGNAFEGTTLELDEDSGALVWTSRIDAELRCGEIGSIGEPRRPAGAFLEPLPAHPCP